MCLFGLVGLTNIEDPKDYWAGKWGRSEGNKTTFSKKTNDRIQTSVPKSWLNIWLMTKLEKHLRQSFQAAKNCYKQRKVCYCGQLKSWSANVLSLDPRLPSRWCTWPDMVGEWVAVSGFCLGSSSKRVEDVLTWSGREAWVGVGALWFVVCNERCSWRPVTWCWSFSLKLFSICFLYFDPAALMPLLRSSLAFL